MKILKIVAGMMVVLVLAVLLLALGKPDEFRVQRSAGIQAPAEKIFALINDFHQWQAWSPWEKLDPAMQRNFGGATSGKGASYAWQSKGKAGAGRMEIIESEAPSRILIDLRFTEPLEGRNTTEYLLQEQAGVTTVSWTMHGPNPWIGKIMQVFFDAEGMVGKDFEQGLAKLKAVAEK